MKKQPFNNRQYIIGILAMSGLMFVQYTFAAEAPKFNFNAIGSSVFTPIFKAIDDNLIYVCTLAATGTAALSPGDLRTRAYHGLVGLFCAGGAWEVTKKVLSLPLS